MSKRPQYLVIVPPGLQRSPALFRAMALAKQSEAEITLALFEFDAGLAKISAKGFDLAAYLEGRRRELEQFAKHLREEDFSVRSDVHWGSPITAQILAQIDRLQPELVIKDVQSESALKRLVLAGRDFELLRHCPVPIMLVKSGTPNLPARILAAVDPLDENGRPHELNGKILGAAERYGMLCGALVEVAHVFQPEQVMAATAGFGGGAWVPDPLMVKEMRGQHDQALHTLGAEYGVEERNLHMLGGFPGSALAQFVETYHTDLLIMGTVSRSGVERFMMGSVAEQLFERLPCDVLAVK
ncbi:MAG TPA: universal stress protein [Gammaproteobacteria bacterium]|jgi:universal stress protein E|nr:universal stress protein [Gammaproteobacteria bacterium]